MNAIPQTPSPPVEPHEQRDCGEIAPAIWVVNSLSIDFFSIRIIYKGKPYLNFFHSLRGAKIACFDGYQRLCPRILKAGSTRLPLLPRIDSNAIRL
jgi:hypothetical protein